jgi:hypothetical protein
MPETARYVFAVHEQMGVTPWILFETHTSNLSVLAHGFLGFRLRPTTTLEEAHQLVEILNERVTDVTYTAWGE